MELNMKIDIKKPFSPLIEDRPGIQKFSITASPEMLEQDSRLQQGG
jgi:hypothetical protein